MQRKNIFTLLFLGALLFVSVGDSVLPKPLSQYSRNTRDTISQWLLGLIPHKIFKKPSQKREEQLDKLQRRAAPSPEEK